MSKIGQDFWLFTIFVGNTYFLERKLLNRDPFYIEFVESQQQARQTLSDSIVLGW